MYLLSLDTECTGLDLYHGSRPYLVTVCCGGGPIFWEWDVDPYTREVDISDEDRKDIAKHLDAADRIILHNSKYDATALTLSGFDFPWEKVEDTLVAGHALASNGKHDLTSMAMAYLDEDVQEFEDKLKDACLDARRTVRREFPDWRLAKHGEPDMPSIKKSAKNTEDKAWKNDAWLPRCIAQRCGFPRYHQWQTVLSTYACCDSETTLHLWLAVEAQLKREGLWNIYREMMKLPQLVWRMENYGFTISRVQQKALRKKYAAESEECSEQLLKMAAKYNYQLKLPKGGGRNQSLEKFLFDVLKLPVVAETDSGGRSMDKNAIDDWAVTLPQESDGVKFVKTLKSKRKRAGNVQFLDSYERFWLPWETTGKRHKDWYVLHPSLNYCSTDTLRFSCTNPNGQQVDKHPDNEGASLRGTFGPAPGREWWKVDFENVELRIPAFESGEDEQIRIFEKPKDPPYFGKYHLAIFDILHPDLFLEHGIECAELFKADWYQFVKNGNFCRQYGGQRELCDRTYHVDGAFDLIGDRYPNITALGERVIRFAEEHGYVETLPDSEVDSKRGYQILTQRGNYGKVKPTLPLCYRVSGTAMWITRRAMIKCDDQLDKWRRVGKFDGWMNMQVHDELLFDFPKSRVHPAESAGKSNLWRARILARLMAGCGNTLIPPIPTPVSLSYCEHSWADGLKFTA